MNVSSSKSNRLRGLTAGPTIQWKLVGNVIAVVDESPSGKGFKTLSLINECLTGVEELRLHNVDLRRIIIRTALSATDRLGFEIHVYHDREMRHAVSPCTTFPPCP